MAVEVYLKSFSIPRDIDSLHHAQQHTWCAPGLTKSTMAVSSFHGRLLAEESHELLTDLEAVMQGCDQPIEVYDVGRLSGWFKALVAGVRKTPTVVVDGEKHVGLEAASEALRRLRSVLSEAKGCEASPERSGGGL